MALTNPYRPGTDEYVDFEIWNNGVNLFSNPARRYPSKSSKPHELDYLRGFHNVQTLGTIKTHLQSQLSVPVRVTSIWLDKTAYVIPKSTGVSRRKRELADLAVVLCDNRSQLPQKYMWILQAKKNDTPSASLGRGISTLKEIELFEKSPKFDLLPPGRRGQNTTIDLGNEFNPNNVAAYRHWSFLMFRETPTVPTPACNPTQWRWNGSGASPQIGSFMEGITQMLLSSTHADHKGAALNNSFKQGWADLHDALINHHPVTKVIR